MAIITIIVASAILLVVVAVVAYATGLAAAADAVFRYASALQHQILAERKRGDIYLARLVQLERTIAGHDTVRLSLKERQIFQMIRQEEDHD